MILSRNIEIFKNASNETNANRLSDYARETYNKYKYTKTITGQLIETKSMRYGIDFGFGDALTVEAYGYYADCIVKAIAVQLDENMNENVRIKLEGDVK